MLNILFHQLNFFEPSRGQKEGEKEFSELLSTISERFAEASE